MEVPHMLVLSVDGIWRFHISNSKFMWLVWNHDMECWSNCTVAAGSYKSCYKWLVYMVAHKQDTYTRYIYLCSRVISQVWVIDHIALFVCFPAALSPRVSASEQGGVSPTGSLLHQYDRLFSRCSELKNYFTVLQQQAEVRLGAAAAVKSALNAIP